MRSFLSRFIGTAVDTIIGVVVVGGVVLFAFVLFFKLVLRANSCPDGEHMGPAGFPAPVCETDELVPRGPR